MKIDVNGWYVYVLTKEPNLILAFGIDSTTGALFPVPQPAALRFVPGELVLDAAARYAYVFGAEGRQVSLFSYRQNTGPLLYERTRFGSPFALKQASSTALIDPGANFILTAGRSRNALGVHKIDAISGAIKEITSSPFHLSADITKTVVHHSGKYVYVFDQAAAKLFTYSRDAISGEINTMHTSFLDLSNQNISAITIHKNFSYLVDDSTNKLLIYSVDPGSGALHRFMQVQLSSKADSIVVTPAY
jgi:6-phosphogluconolactonase (cycloisomerase 2 family)